MADMEARRSAMRSRVPNRCNNVLLQMRKPQMRASRTSEKLQKINSQPQSHSRNYANMNDEVFISNLQSVPEDNVLMDIVPADIVPAETQSLSPQNHEQIDCLTPTIDENVVEIEKNVIDCNDYKDYCESINDTGSLVGSLSTLSLNDIEANLDVIKELDDYFDCMSIESKENIDFVNNVKTW